MGILTGHSKAHDHLRKISIKKPINSRAILLLHLLPVHKNMEGQRNTLTDTMCSKSRIRETLQKNNLVSSSNRHDGEKWRKVTGKSCYRLREMQRLSRIYTLAPHERLTDLAVVPRVKPHTGAAARQQPRDFPRHREMRAFVSCMA